MIELIVYEYLKDVLDVPVFMEKPTKNIPTEYVLIEKTGTSVENLIQEATFAVQSYSDSKYKAALLNEHVKVKMNEIVLLTEVSKSKCNSDYDFTDTTTKEYRYQAVYELVF